MGVVTDVAKSVHDNGTKSQAVDMKNVDYEEVNARDYTRGRTIGNPKLSEKASKYYEELKKKFSNMDFVLVSTDQKETAKAQAASYGNASKMVVLIDEEKIERMAEDENYRRQYEAVIRNGANSLSQMAQKLSSAGVNVKSFGMQVKDGRASFFAAVDKSFQDQRTRQQKRIAEKKAAQKADARKAEKKAAEKKRTEKRKENRSEKADREAERMEAWNEDAVEVISASSVDELMLRLEDYRFARMSDHMQTESEKQIGQSVDYSV